MSGAVAWAQDNNGGNDLVPGAIGIGQPRSTGYTGSAGSAVEGLALALAPGRKGVQPSLTLSYSSSFGAALELGVGWSMPIGSIQRSPSHGIPGGSNVDEFVFSLAGLSDTLIPVGGGAYRPRFETTVRSCQFLGDHWEVRDGKGTLYRFGGTPGTRIDGLQWMLDLVQDLNGNTVTFSYTQDGGYFYPSEIDYAGHGSSLGSDQVLFDYDTSRNDQTISYALGVEQQRHKLLRRVSSFAAGALVRRYELTYTDSPTTHRPLLTGIDVVGADDATRIHSRTYTYQTGSLGFSSSPTSGAFPVAFLDSNGRDTGARTADVNGDGFLDVLDNGSNVWLGDGHDNFVLNAQWSASLQMSGVHFVDGNQLDTGTRLVDLNGDLRPDLLVGTASGRRVLLNNGTGWDETNALSQAYETSLAGLHEPAKTKVQFVDPRCNVDGGPPPDAGIDCEQLTDVDVQFSLVGSNGEATGATLADVNGDGLTDIVWSFQTTPATFNLTAPDGGIFSGTTLHLVPVVVQAVYLNNGGGWTKSAGYSASLAAIPPFVVDTQPQGFDVLDVNGDGAADVVNTEAPGNPDPRGVFLSNGSGWVSSPEYTSSLQSSQIISISGGKSQGLVPVDFNRDGLLDYVRSDGTVQLAYRNSGQGWVEDAGEEQVLSEFGVVFIGSDGNSTGFDFQDVNGDGIVDLIRNRAGQGNLIWHATGPVPDLLSTATTGLGEQTSITYLPSTSFNNRSAAGIEQLPSILSVVSSLTRSDGRGNTFASTVSYAGGLFDQARGEASRFRSFASASTIDSRNVLTIRRFAQTEALAGSVTGNEIYDTGGTLRKDTTATYTTTDAGNGVTQISLAQADEITTDPAGTLHTRIRYTYDSDLNNTEVDKDGDVAVTGDEGRTVFRFAKNASVGIRSALSATLVYDATGTLVSQGIILYDGNSTEGKVSVGNATKLVDSVQLPGPQVVVKKLQYDGFGNVIKAFDRNGGATTFAYDGTNTFQTKVTDPSGRVRTAVVDARFGSDTVDTDPNHNATTRVYDAFGRLVRETKPGDECSPNGTRSITYSSLGDASSQSVKVSLTEIPGQPGTLDTTVFFDGFAQQYRHESEGPAGRNVAVETEFDDVGNEAALSLPFFVGDPMVFETTQRDALRRVILSTTARGEVMTMTYRGAARDVVDGRGNKSTIINDAYGNAIEHDQFVGGKTLVTKTKFDVLGNRVQIIDAAGEVTNIAYNSLARRTKVVDPAMGTFAYAYDSNGNLTSQQGPTGRIALTYNPSNDLIRKQLPNGQTLQFDFDGGPNGIGRVTRIKDAAGLLDLAYDPRGHVFEKRRTIEGKTYVVGYDRDSMGRLTTVTYPDGFTTNYTYDASGLAQAISDGEGKSIVSGIQYNALGRMVKAQFGNGVTSNYTFDEAGLMDTIDTANGHGKPLQQLTMSYDADWNVQSIVDREVSGRGQTFAYDELNRLTHATGAYGDESYEYDAIGNFIRKGNLVFARDPVHAQQVTCAVDLNLASQHANGVGADGRFVACLSSLLQPSSGLTSAEQGQVQTIRSHGHGQGTGQSLLLKYDAAGNIVADGDRELEYDPEGRLLEVEQEGSSNGHGSDQKLESNVYDSNGDRVALEDKSGNTTFFIDNIYEEDQYHGGQARHHVRIGAALFATTVTPAYLVHLIDHLPADALSMCADGGPHHQPPPAATCAVAGQGGGWFGRSCTWLGLAALFLTMRSRRPRWRARLRAGLQVAKESGVRLARSPGSGGTALLVVLALLMQLAPRVGATPPSAPKDQRFYYHLDHVGNTNVITDDQGNEFERREYKPFGEQFVRSGSDDLEMSFNGHRWDDPVGLYYFGARHYDPLLGRFVSPDTQVPNETPQALHRYVFNMNNPVRFIDLDGHSIFSDAWDWVSNNFVPILVGALLVAAGVIVLVASGGTAAPLLAIVIAGALAGAGLAVIIASAAYKNLSFGDYLAIALAGAIIGASIGLSIGILTGAAGASALPAFLNASAVYGATAGGLSSATLGIINGVRPKDFLGLVILGTVLGYFSGEAVGAHFTPAIDTVDVTPSLSVFGVNVPTTYLAIYAGAVNGFFTTSNITGLDTHLPHWLGVVVTLSGILIPGGAVLFGAAAAPQAASTALNLAPTLL